MAGSASGKFAYPTGREGALTLGYDAAFVEAAGPGLLSSYCGVGNPFSLGPVHAGAVVLDVGCGAGFDLYIAANLAGPSGRVYGVDLTEAMVVKARENLRQAGIAKAEVQQLNSEILPFSGDLFDAVISNGVVNLSTNKEMLFSEILRVLKPGGRFAFADIVLEQQLPQDLAASPEAWSQ